ncbi:RNA interference defective protein 10 [Caenorhabditis elegans]|uniref:RNA interference defective protein 10 n=1 Tax=Caenorhabditis elegans TaxID=6239 RepID=RDE10_CAEEL|nr:RNA interference defective protein 10 [Caenorhabditis elegans]Q9N3S2.1 RecName: Full=RNA interference defective protein 10 [Caenorhabditis elegans]CCD72548.1 RNA interference defective protein 10 [Caenorhabditis elegans]|eukprot:NP_491178.1 RNA interference defective protein 10 [Caenorhabditis elegans]
MSNHRSNFRDYQREGIRANNAGTSGDAVRQNGNPISVAKHVDGKKSVYMLFLRQIGQKKFLTEQGHRYNQNDQADKDIMTRYYHGMCPDLKQKFEREVAEHNGNRGLVIKTKHQRAQRNREMRHRNPDEFQQLRRAHLETLSQTPSVIALPRDINHVLHITEDLDAFCLANRKKAKRIMTSYIAQRSDDPGNPLLCEDYTMQIVSVFPVAYAFKPSINKLSSYPAEISVTTFNLKNGIIQNESRFVKFDAAWFYPDADDIGHEELSRKAMADELGISPNGPADGCEPYEVFEWLQHLLKQHPKSPILCDRAQFNFVYYGIKTLATYTGINAITFFQEVIIPSILSIQDFTSVILEKAPTDVPRVWRDVDICNQFQYHFLIPRTELNLFCSFHENKPSPTKYNCVKAHNARLLDNFFTVIKGNRLQGFVISPPVHEICIQDGSDTSLPQTILARTISRNDAEVYAARQRDTDEQYDVHQEGPSNHDQYEFASEPLDFEEDSDEENYNEQLDVPYSYNDHFISSSSVREPEHPSARSRDVAPNVQQESVVVPAPRRLSPQRAPRPSQNSPNAYSERKSFSAFPSEDPSEDYETPIISHIMNRNEADQYFNILDSVKPGQKYKIIKFDDF